MGKIILFTAIVFSTILAIRARKKQEEVFDDLDLVESCYSCYSSHSWDDCYDKEESETCWDECKLKRCDRCYMMYDPSMRLYKKGCTYKEACENAQRYLCDGSDCEVVCCDSDDCNGASSVSRCLSLLVAVAVLALLRNFF